MGQGEHLQTQGLCRVIIAWHKIHSRNTGLERRVYILDTLGIHFDLCLRCHGPRGGKSHSCLAWNGFWGGQGIDRHQESDAEP